MHVVVYMYRLEDNLPELLLPIHYLSFGDQIQILRLSDKIIFLSSEAILSGIDSLVPSSSYLLLIHRKATDLYTLILCPALC